MLHFMKECFNLTRDLIHLPQPTQILKGESLFRPFMKYQQSWMNHFYPNDSISPEYDAWFYLHKYMLPLIRKHASAYHNEGIVRLNLDTEKKPDFKSFQDLFYKISHGFEIYKVTKEIAPMEYFSLIRERKFPCIEKIRPVNELFCGNEPDFWHEAIGHIAPLCFPEIQDFYLQIANYMLAAKSAFEFDRNLAIAWTITEYAFIKERGQNKMIGAALVGSHLAHMRYLHRLLSIEPAARNTIINSQFYSENSPLPRDDKGNLRFFSLDSLNIDHLFSKGMDF